MIEIRQKDYGYIRHRYYEHPVYQDDAWKIVNSVDGIFCGKGGKSS